MAQHERTNREKTKELEEDSSHKKKTARPIYDQLKASDEGAVNLIGEPSVDRHAALLAGVHSDKQRANMLIQLQKSYGNAYVQRLLKSRAVQAKLTVNPPDDEYEREADRVADVVTQTPASEVQRQEEEEEELMMKRASEVQRQPIEEEEELMMKPTSSRPSAVSENLEAQIDAARNSGQPLTGSVRDSIEPQFGSDFSQVRIHTDAKADELARQLEAEAFTSGHDVFFKEGAYQPDSTGGKGLIAHELTHVVQQKAAPMVQRQNEQAPAGATATAETQTESAAAPEESAILIWTNEVIIPVTRAHTVLAGSGPAGERAGQAMEDVVAARESIEKLMRLYLTANPDIAVRLTWLHGVMSTALATLRAQTGEGYSIDDIHDHIDPSKSPWGWVTTAIASSRT